MWWPSTATIVYPAHAPQPLWDDEVNVTDAAGNVIQRGSYVDPVTRQPLCTWDQALDSLDDDAEPEYVVRFGRRVDVQGVLGGTPQADKMIGYITKYLTKSVGECHTPETATAQDHQRRLWEELRYTPCSPRCANWLRYGVQPKTVRAKTRAGHCKAKVHQLDTLGIGGRRVLVSRDWSGKTLADHRWDQAAWVRKFLSVSLGHTAPIGEDDAAQVDAAREGRAPAPLRWERVLPGEPGSGGMHRRLLRLISTRIQHRAVLSAARVAGPPSDLSATSSDRLQEVGT